MNIEYHINDLVLVSDSATASLSGIDEKYLKLMKIEPSVIIEVNEESLLLELRVNRKPSWYINKKKIKKHMTQDTHPELFI